MRGFSAILVILIMICGLIETALIQSSVPQYWLLFDLLAIGTFLFGILRLRYDERTPYDLNKWKAWASILLLLNVVMLGLLWILASENLGYILSASFIIPLMNFEEVGFYLALKYRERSSTTSDTQFR